jgi:hypothetical protein
MIQLNKVIINGVYGDNYAALFLFDCSSYKFTLIQILKENVFITQPIKNNNLIRHQPSC